MAQSAKRPRGTNRQTPVAVNRGRGKPAVVNSPIRTAREAADISQMELAVRAGLTQNAVSKAELRGYNYGQIHLATARALADALGTTVDDLFPRTPQKGGAP